MKKILLYLLLACSIPSFAQADFTEGISLSGNGPTIATQKLISQEPTNGNLNYIDAISLPISNPVKDSLQKKLNLPTGFLQGLQLSINADPTKYNIAAGYYTVTDFTDLANPFVKIINYAGATGLTPAYLNTANSTYVALDINGAVVSSASPFTNAQRRTLAIIGNVVHSNLTTINVTNEIKAPIVAGTNQLHDFMRAVGFLNEEGNIYTANGANLQINKSAGRIFGMGINSVDYLNPHELSLPAQTALTFAYRLRTGTQYANTTSVDPNNWDNNGVLTAVSAGNKWTIQHFNIFQSGLTRAQHGQTVYNSYAEALAALPTDPFVTEQNIADNAVFRAYLIIKQGTTDLQAAITAGTALFVPVDKFGNVVGNGAIALTYSNIVAALGFTPENVANKAIDFSTVNNTLYPTVQASKTYSDLYSSPYNESYVDVLQKSASIKNLYFKRKTEGDVFFAVGMVVNGQAVQYDFRPDQDNFCKIGFIYSNTLAGSIMNETGRKTISANILEYAIRMRKEGSVLGQNWIPNHTAVTTGSVIGLTREFYIDGVLTDVNAMPLGDFVINEFTMVQKYSGANIGDATPLFEIVTTHTFKDGRLTITNNITVLQSVEMFQGYSAKITGYLAAISNLKIDNDTKIIPTSTGTNFFYDIAAKSATFYGNTDAIAIEIGEVGENINKNKTYGSKNNKILYWDRASTPSIYWQWLPNIDNGGIPGTGTILPIGTKLISQNTIFTSTNINSILK